MERFEYGTDEHRLTAATVLYQKDVAKAMKLNDAERAQRIGQLNADFERDNGDLCTRLRLKIREQLGDDEIEPHPGPTVARTNARRATVFTCCAYCAARRQPNHAMFFNVAKNTVLYCARCGHMLKIVERNKFTSGANWFGQSTVCSIRSEELLAKFECRTFVAASDIKS